MSVGEIPLKTDNRSLKTDSIAIEFLQSKKVRLQLKKVWSRDNIQTEEFFWR